MLPTALIFLCIGLSLAATAGVIYVDKRSVALVRELFQGENALSGFQRSYLKVYLAAMMGDWLQGPFVYALYESYGFSRGDNARLFVAGFGSSAIFGTFVGSLADTHGRKKFAVLYCLLCITSCLTKHVNAFGVLVIGRVTAGIATSLLFSVFDAWLVSENKSRGFDDDELAATFSIAVFWNGLVAIAAGQIGEMAADMVDMKVLASPVHYGGYCAPFDVANLVLALCMWYIVTTWPENYGQTGSSSTTDSEGSSLRQATQVMLAEPQVLLCGVVCALFEASMFIFVFNWTPCLMEEGVPNPPFGHIFSAFMIMAMLGSQMFSYLTQWMPLERVGLYTVVVSLVCNTVPMLSSSVVVRLFSFLVFEGCVGLYFPMMGTLKAQVVPDELRSTIYNLYRVPLNAIVTLTLVTNVDTEFSFAIASLMLAIAAFAQHRLAALRAEGEHRASGAGSYEYERVAMKGPAAVALELGALGAAVPATLGKAEAEHDADWESDAALAAVAP